MKFGAVIVAGGVGSRLGAALPKQFLPLNGQPIVIYSIQAFLKAFPDIQVVLVVHPNYLDDACVILEQFVPHHTISIVPGGTERFYSVKNGLKALQEDIDIVAIHDAARPLITAAFVSYLMKQAAQYATAIPCLAISESLRKVSANGESKAVDRINYRSIQTPQCFKTEVVKQAYQQNFSDKFADSASVVEASGVQVTVVEGISENVKITHPIDLLWTEQILNQRD